MGILYTSPKYLFVKDGVYYYIRRVPRAIAEHYRLAIIRVSLRTKLHSTAVRRMAKINQEIERDWEQLMFSSVSNIVDRFRTKNTATYISSKNTSFESDAPTLLEAMDFYLSEQGSDRPKGFYQGAFISGKLICPQCVCPAK